tara:strand:+ start:476 stop:1354 length:879 start_codon:yes stop_codon:yes gene_type:complete
MLSQPKIIIKVEVPLMMSKTCRLFAFLLISISPQLFSDTIDPIEVSLDVFQGGIVVGKVAPGYRLTYSNRELHISSSGTFVFGVGRDASGYAELKVFERNDAMSSKKIEIVERDYNIQYVEGVPQRTVTPTETDLTKIQRDAELVKAARKHELVEPLFLEGFVRPIQGQITGVYGSQRIYNGTPGRPHYGIDYAAPKGSNVVAPAPGIIRLSESDLFYSGGTIILDHGYGISSSFLHLSQVLVEVGDRVNFGDVIGLVGSTGRSTGPHLDWRMNWFDVRIDPEIVLDVLPRK